MAILSLADLAIYAPTVTITGPALTGAILRAQILAEGPMGAHRPLELQQFIETKRLNVKLGTCLLSYTPVAVVPAPVIEIRQGNYVDSYGREHGITDWEVVSANGYQIDPETSTLNLLLGSLDDYGRLSARYPNEARLTYTSGFDFTLSTTKINEIKAAVGAILEYTSALGGQRQYTKSIKGLDEAVTFSGGSLADELEPWFLILKKYEPRGF